MSTSYTPSLTSNTGGIDNPRSETFAPSGSWTSNTSYSGEFITIGKVVFINYYLLLTGAPNSTSLSVEIPTAIAIDETKLSGPTNSQFAGDNIIIDASPAAHYAGICYYNKSTNNIQVFSGTSTMAGVTQAAPITFAASDQVQIKVRLPIL